MRSSHPMGSLLSDLTGYNVDLSSVLPNVGATTQQSIFTAVGQSPQIQKALLAQGQQAAAQSLAEKLLANKKTIMYAGVAAIALLAVIAFRKRR